MHVTNAFTSATASSAVCCGRGPVHVTNAFTSATASSASVEVAYGANAPPSPVNDVHAIDHSIVKRVRKW